MKVDYLQDALGELKNAFKDESFMSNAAVTNLILDEEIVLQNIDDQVTDRSCHLMETDKYLVHEHIPEGYNALSGQPGLIDVSSTYDDYQDHLDAEREFNKLADMIKGNLSERRKPTNTISIQIDDVTDDDEYDKSSRGRNDIDDESLSTGSGSSYSSQTDGSLLFNAWNEDYEGNADPDVLKRLMHAKTLPRGLDPYIVTQIKRAQIIQQMKELEEDESSQGSCQVMFNVVCGDGPRIFDDDGSGDATDDSNSLVNSLKEDESDASLDTDDFNFKKPKKSPIKSPLIPDKKYKPMEATSKLKSRKQNLPIQKLNNPMMNDENSSGTYEEKEMEYTLQNYVGREQLENQVPAEISVEDAYMEHEVDGNETIDESDDSGIELDRYALKMKRFSQEDDEIFDDRSVMSASEADHYREYMKKRLIEKSHYVEFHQDSALSYFLKLFSDPNYSVETIESGLSTDDVQTSYDETDDEKTKSLQMTMTSKSSDDLSLNSIKSKEYSSVPFLIKPTIETQRFVSELSVAVGSPKPLSPYAQTISHAAPLLETGTSLNSTLSYNYNPTHGPAVFSFPDENDDESVDDDDDDCSTEKAISISASFDNNHMKKKTLRDDVDLLIDALDLNLQNTTTFPSSEGEEFVVGLPVDGLIVKAPTTKYGRIIYPEELRTMMLGVSSDSMNDENDSMEGNTGVALVHEYDHSDDFDLKLKTAFSEPESEIVAEISNRNQQTFDDASPVPSVFHFDDELSFKEQRRNELAYELKQENELKKQAREDLERDLESKTTTGSSSTPRNNKSMPLSPRNIQSKDSDSIDTNKVKNELSIFKDSISKRRSDDVIPTPITNQ